jgi:hypothetical protein
MGRGDLSLHQEETKRAKTISGEAVWAKLVNRREQLEKASLSDRQPDSHRANKMLWG